MLKYLNVRIMHTEVIKVLLFIQTLCIVFASQFECSEDISNSCIVSPPQRAFSTMKAVRVHRYGGPEVLEYETSVPVPNIGNNDVLVRIKAVGVNPVETYIRSGQYSRLPDALPFTLGGDAAGIVEEVGSEVTGYTKGDRVFSFLRTNSGAYAQFSSIPSTNLHPLPEALDFSQGASLGVPYLTAYRGLFVRANCKPGDTVLVHGASGGVGVAAVQFARAYGMKVIGTAGTSEGIELVKKAGAHYTLNHRKAGYLAGVLRITNGEGVDVVFENAAHLNLEQDLLHLARGGRVVVVGSRGTNEINPRNLMAKEASVSGVMLFNMSEKERREALSAVQAGIDNGWLRPIVGKSFDLEKASDCHRDIIDGKGALGKSVLTID